MQKLSRRLSAAVRPAMWAAGCLAVIGWMSSGCSAEHKATMRQGAFTRIVTPQPPPFLTGPAGLLLTNWPGFSARVEVQSETSLGSEKSSSGQLLGRGAKLLYAPEGDAGSDTHEQPGGYSFIWDVATGRGYVLSEALQAYAPVVAQLHVTNLDHALGKMPAQRLSGHPCETANVTARLADSPDAEFAVFKAIDLNGFPLRIQTQTNSIPFALTFSKVRFEALSADVFEPPNGFTQYPNPQAMADELAARQHNLHRRKPAPVVEMPQFNQQPY